MLLRTLPSRSIDLIYIDPPFFSGAMYNVIWGDANEVRTPLHRAFTVAWVYSYTLLRDLSIECVAS